nr:WG repeat-containing protein [uncultured Anaerosporobacter sp.]
MKKRWISRILILCMCMGIQIPQPVSAAANYNEEDVTWIGTTSEYKKTVDSFFDANGYRVMPIGEVGKDGYLENKKYGIVDRKGAWIAQPIYDEIEALYPHEYEGKFKIKNDMKPTETIFVNGYVQATRNGKMGLLDTKGKEVIPCKYDAVGMPSEGISRLIVNNPKDGSSYLGYWSLDKGKEIVNPNKYIISSKDASYATAAYGIWTSTPMPDEEGKYFMAYDFNDGYALVPTGKRTTVTMVSISGNYGKANTYQENPNGRNTISYELVYAQIIDKNGKEILPKAYPYLHGGYMTYYPQVGPYMVYHEVSKKLLHMKSDAGDDIMYKSHVVGGVVGTKGIVIPARYHGGIVGNAAVGWKPIDAEIQLLPELSLVITDKCATTEFKESGSKRGAINFKNKTVIPFKFFGGLGYSARSNVLFDINYVYRPDGTKVSNIKGKSTQIKNGYSDTYFGSPVNGHVTITESTASYDFGADTKFTIKSIVSVKTGKKYSHKNLLGSEGSSVSTKNTIWINKGDKKNPKWGLVDLNGKVLLPFEYKEIVAGDNWTAAEESYALVKKGDKWGMVDTKGKVLLSCSYRSIDSPTDGYQRIRDYATGKYGVYSIKAKKVTTPCQFDLFTIKYNPLAWGAIAGTTTMSMGKSLYALLNMDTGTIITANYLSMKPSSRGLFYNTYGDRFGPDGRIVFPREEKTEDMTLIVKDKKVGYIPATRLARKGVPLPNTPRVEKDTESKEKPITTKAYLVDNPEKRLYKVGEGFDIKGLIVHYEDATGARIVADNKELTFYTSKTVELTQGRPFTTTGIKDIEVLYKGEKVGTFDVKVIEDSKGDILGTGDYYMQIFGKYLYPVYNGGVYHMELSDKMPKEPFHVKLVDYSDKNGPMYTIAYDGTYIGQPSSSDGDQLMSTLVPHRWRINQYSTFSTIRDYGSQKLLVNASGKKKENGTKITVWSYTGSAPEHAKIKLIKAD